MIQANEKAIELVARFENSLNHIEMGTNGIEDMIHTRAKFAALLCGEEIVKQLDELCKPEYTSFWHGDKAGETVDGYALKEFWEQVNEAINNLP